MLVIDSATRSASSDLPRPAGDSAPIPRAVLLALYPAVAILFAAFAVRTAVSWKNYADLDHNSVGTAVTLAVDARNDLLYRPIVSELGYGGTRYAPLSPMIHATLMRIGIDPITSGYLIGLLATVIVLTGLFALMRRLKVPPALAAAMTLLVLAATCVRTTVLEIKPDLLPLGLNLWGLVFILDSSESPNRASARLRTFAAAICFALALAAKISSIFGLGAAILWLLSRKRFQQTFEMGAAWGACLLVIVGVTEWASDGRAGTIFRLCGGAGSGLAGLASSPSHFLDESLYYDRAFFGFFLIAVFLIAVVRNWTSLPTILFLVTTLGTGIILASPGTRYNHLVDLNAAAILVLATFLSQAGRLRLLILLGAVGLALLAAVGCWRQTKEIRHYAARDKMLASLADTDASTVNGPIFSEDPLLPILRGQRPYMLDPFMLRVLRFKDPTLTQRLWGELAEEHFKAVILHNAPDDPIYTDPADGNFGPGFVEQMQKTYVLAGVHGKFHVYLPKPR